jgi:hypothetical protein
MNNFENYDNYYQAQTQFQDASYPELQHSGLGIGSFVIALLCGFGEFAMVMAAGFLEATTPGGLDGTSPAAILLGLGLFGGLFLAFVGIVLGVAGLVMSNRKKVFALLGMVFNAMVILGVVGLMVIGMAMS